MFLRPGPKVIKHCPEGHEMPMSARKCPRCAGVRAPAANAPAGREMTEMTMIFGAPVAAAAPSEPEPPSDRVALLTAVSGPESGRRIEVTPGRWKLGKAPREEAGFTALPTGDAFMSREHFALEAGTAAVVLRDLGSTNGTFVNGERVERHVLREGDQVRAGESTWRVTLSVRPPA